MYDIQGFVFTSLVRFLLFVYIHFVARLGRPSPFSSLPLFSCHQWLFSVLPPLFLSFLFRLLVSHSTCHIQKFTTILLIKMAFCGISSNCVHPIQFIFTALYPQCVRNNLRFFVYTREYESESESKRPKRTGRV